jgi:hypothetical protein
MPGLFVEMGVSITFSLGCPQTTILPISTSQVDGIIDISHRARLIVLTF